MASKSGINSGTVVTIGVLAIGGYAAYKILPPLIKKLGSSSSSSTPGMYAGSTTGSDDYYPPYDSGQQPGWLQQLLNSLGSIGGKGNPNSAMMNNGSGKSSATSDTSSGGESPDFFNSMLEGLYNGQLQGSESNSLFGGDNLYTTDPGLQDPSTYQIGYVDPNAGMDSFLNSVATNVPAASGDQIGGSYSDDPGDSSGGSSYFSAPQSSGDSGGTSVASNGGDGGFSGGGMGGGGEDDSGGSEDDS